MTPIKQLSLFPTVCPCCLSVMLNDKQASKEIIYVFIVDSL